MTTYEHRNAVIRGTFLGVEDHGIFTFNLTLDYGGSAQHAGNYTLQSAGHTAPNGFWLLRQIINAAQADSWETLPGKHVVALIEGGLVRGLAPILTDGSPVIFSEVLEGQSNVTSRMVDMTTCQARHCTEDAWEGGGGFPPANAYPFRLCVAHWNTDGHHPIIVETESEGVVTYHIWPNPPDEPWRLSNE